MKRGIRVLAVVFFAFLLCSCHRGHDEIITGPYTPAISSPVKIRVADVWNDTHAVFDVDVIGLLWSGLEDSLRKRGMLWSEQMGGQPFILEAHIVNFKKGNMAARLLPWAGDTVLSVECTLRTSSQCGKCNAMVGSALIASCLGCLSFGYAHLDLLILN